MTEHAKSFADSVLKYSQANHRPAVDEPANDFERGINTLHDLQSFIAEVKSLLKPIEAAERKLRDANADSLRVHFGHDLKEGTNTYEMSNGRKIKFNNKITRTVDVSGFVKAREAYADAKDGHGGQTFDDLFRVKYEVAMAPLKKLTGEAAKAVSHCIETKYAAPELKVD